MELYVFDMNLNRLGIIDDFVQVNIERNYTKMSQLSMVVDGDKEIIDLLKKGRIVAKVDDVQRGYLILTRQYIDERSSQLEVIAPSLNILLNRRLVLGQQSFRGAIEDVLKSFVAVNAVAPENPKRIIPNLQISTNRGIAGTAKESGSNDPLDEFLYSTCNKYNLSWDVLLDVHNKKFVFDVWKGVDRSVEQMANPHVIFSKDRENVLRQDYVESDSDYKNVAVVAGEGEGAARAVITVNDEISGLDRHEIFIDARDLQSTYQEDEEEITIPPAEYKEMLKERGKSKLVEYPKIVTLESEVDLFSNGEYGIDYNLGDIVSVKNDDLNLIMHTRIVSATETTTKAGESLKISFGSNIPTLLDKIQRTVK